ncbi:hypothetical protein Taro_048119 [Colocasia esculenta]|uniref:Uncharacterized protein n=1 Tax=Colocasia esculenta TaxID=4460 RepID=A0A843X842_COLES|nr:hypothetical protein [Colocasia esculenta]
MVAVRADVCWLCGYLSIATRGLSIDTHSPEIPEFRKRLACRQMQAGEIYEKLWFSGRLEDEKKVPTLILPHSENATAKGDVTIDSSMEADATSVYRGAHGDRDTSNKRVVDRYTQSINPRVQGKDGLSTDVPKSSWTIVERRGVVQFAWELAEGLAWTGGLQEILTRSELEQLENPQGRIRVSAGFMAGELGVNIACRQDSQPGG